MVVTACRTSYRRAVTADNLIDDFGHNSVRGTALMSALANALSDARTDDDGTKVRMLFEEWRTLYGQVADLSQEQLRRINGTLRFAQTSGVSDIPECLFVVHTFNCLLAKLLAAEIVAAHGLASGQTFAADLLATPSDSRLLACLRHDIELGRFFDAVGIHGFVEEAIFSWYLDAASTHQSTICAALRDVLAGLALYRTDRIATCSGCPPRLLPRPCARRSQKSTW